jgi:hypothetical protein
MQRSFLTLLSFIPKENNQWSGNILQEKDMQQKFHFLSKKNTHTQIYGGNKNK